MFYSVTSVYSYWMLYIHLKSFLASFLNYTHFNSKCLKLHYFTGFDYVFHIRVY